MRRLRNRRVLILRAIASHVEQYGYPPVISEIGRRAGLSSKSSVAYQLSRLAALGLIAYTPHRHRAVRLLLTPGVATVPVVRCEPCGQDMPADHVCPAVVEDLQRYGTPGDLPEGGR